MKIFQEETLNNQHYYYTPLLSPLLPPKHFQEHIMPLTLTITQGVLSKAQAASAVEKLTESFLPHHNLVGNTVILLHPT